MKKLIAILILAAIGCSACSSPSAQGNSTSSAAEAVPPSSSQTDSGEPSSPSSAQASSTSSMAEAVSPPSSQTNSGEPSSPPAAPYRQGFTQEQWQGLQDQKELYGDLTSFERKGAQFNGSIDCYNFIHLHWEHLIEGQLIDYVGADKFESWLREFEKDAKPNQCVNIYSFAQRFSIEPNELILFIKEKGTTHIYDVDTVKRRYEYFASGLQEEVSLPATAPPYSRGLTKKQWQRLQDQKEIYENLATDEEREEAVSTGRIECIHFEHLFWEHYTVPPFGGTFCSDYVGADKFNEWKTERERTGQCVDFYSFAEHFSIDPKELIARMKERKFNLDFETFERRFEYFEVGLQK